MIVYMVFDSTEYRVHPAGWVKPVVFLDIVVYLSLLFIFPDLWFTGYTFVVLITGTIVSYLVYEKLFHHNDTPWKKPADILVAVDVGVNVIFCIIMLSAMMIGVLIAAGA